MKPMATSARQFTFTVITMDIGFIYVDAAWSTKAMVGVSEVNQCNVATLRAECTSKRSVREQGNLIWGRGQGRSPWTQVGSASALTCAQEMDHQRRSWRGKKPQMGMLHARVFRNK